MKTLNLKRVASLALVLVLALSLAVPSFAAEYSTIIQGNYQEVPISVTLSATNAALVINPLKMPVDIGTGANKATVKGQQIVTTTPLYIANTGAVALDVAATFTAKGGTASAVVNDVTAESAKTLDKKFMTVNLEVFAADGIDDAALKVEKTVNDAFVALKSEDAVLTATPGNATSDAATKANTAYTKDATPTGSDGLTLKAGAADKAVAGGVAFFRVTGFVGQKAAWATTDQLVTKVVFTFTPAEDEEEEEEDSLPDGGDLTLQGGGTTLSLLTDGSGKTVSIADAKCTNVENVQWSSSNQSFATVLDAGSATGSGNTIQATVTPVAKGEVTITCTYEDADSDATYQSTLTLTVED